MIQAKKKKKKKSIIYLSCATLRLSPDFEWLLDSKGLLKESMPQKVEFDVCLYVCCVQTDKRDFSDNKEKVQTSEKEREREGGGGVYKSGCIL